MLRCALHDGLDGSRNFYCPHSLAPTEVRAAARANYRQRKNSTYQNITLKNVTVTDAREAVVLWAFRASAI